MCVCVYVVYEGVVGGGGMRLGVPGGWAQVGIIRIRGTGEGSLR